MYFYRDLFASLCFIAFGAALAFKHPYLYFAAMMCAALSRASVRKQWEDPVWAEKILSKWAYKKSDVLEDD